MPVSPRLLTRASRRRFISAVESLEERTLMAFGLTTTSNSYTVDTGALVTFSVARTTANSAAVGDLTSFKYNGTEFEAPHSSTGRYAHYESGLSPTTSVSATVDPNGNWIEITCDDTAGVGVIQYYMAHKGDPNIYMATYAPGPAEPSPGEMRFIAYLNWSLFPNHPNPSDTSGGQTTIESSDIFEEPANGHTHSKYYGEVRMIDDIDHGATGPNSGAFMFMGNRETGGGGPFFKDIDFQSTGASVELYNYMVSGHSQTDPWRAGLQGPYALQLTNGSAPAAPDYSFIDGLGLAGWVAPSARGTLTGTASGVPAGHAVTVALNNSVAQYWATPSASGSYMIANVKPGTYTETLYQDELAVGTQTVTISAAATTGENIADTFYLPPAIFRIGTWDGTPLGFLNADNITTMHPSDTRMSPWADATGLTNFTVGTNTDGDWPMAEWQYQTTSGPVADIDNRITFNLTDDQAATPMTLRIGITRLDHGRPVISVNGGPNSAAPPLASEPDSRGVTVGNWRGNNFTYTYNISTSALHSGMNTIDIKSASGSASGGNFLSPYYIYDAIDLVSTSSLTNAPHVANINVAPANPTIVTSAQQQFTASAIDQFGNPILANFTWSSTVGAVDGTGLFSAPGAAATGSVTAASGSVSGSANLIIVTPLQVASAEFDFQTAQALVLGFNSAVDPSMLAGAIGIQNLSTQTTVPTGSVHLNFANLAGMFTFDGILPDGNYRATIPASASLDAAGDHLASDYTFDFFVQSGDADRNRTVDAADFTLLAQNFDTSGATFGQGDFNYDGKVNALDFNLLAAAFGKTLAAPSAPVVIEQIELAAAPAPKDLFGSVKVESPMEI